MGMCGCAELWGEGSPRMYRAEPYVSNLVHRRQILTLDGPHPVPAYQAAPGEM